MWNDNDSNKTKIFYFCYNFKKNADIEAINKEAISYFLHFKDTLNFSFKFISIEEDLESNKEELEVLDNGAMISYWGTQFETLLQYYCPNIIHVFSNSLEGYHLFEKNFKERSFTTIYTVTGINPFPYYDDGYLIHLRHAIDVGNIHITTPSSFVKAKLSEMGLRSTLIVNKSTMTRDSFKRIKSDHFTIGFASAPMSDESWEDRGLNLLLELAQKKQSIRFKIAWRNSSLEKIYKEMDKLSLNNIELINGYINMYDFYQDVDAIITPYTSLQNNHSSPLSIVEALALGIPVIVTDVVGISDVIQSCKVGVVAQPNIDDLINKITHLVSEYQFYEMQAKLLGGEKFGANNINNHQYLKLYNLLKEQLPAPSLKIWQDKLNDKSKYLVMNKEGIADYYNDELIASLYDEHRFSSYPMRTYDEMERSAIKYMIEKFAPNSSKKMLDVASGDGRIMRELIKFGYVHALENSGYMISVSSKKLPAQSKVIYIKDNFFDFETRDKFDVITIFRFIRHYNYNERQEIYRKLYRMLNDNGIILCEFPNKNAELQLRAHIGWENFNVYDVFWHEFEIIDEMEENYFKILHSIPYGELLFPQNIIKDQFMPISHLICFCKEPASIVIK